MYTHGLKNDNGHLTAPDLIAPDGKKIDLRPVVTALVMLSYSIKHAFDGVEIGSPEYEVIKAGIMDQIDFHVDKLSKEI